MGLTLLASRESLYLKTWWEPLIGRRKAKLRIIIYKIYHYMVPHFLPNIIPKLHTINQCMLPDNHKTIVFQNIG